ncbi:hypothetical protein J6590_006235 [Homalodisca vitripennis]|nr:hypothetical protein J6590_006235 [Homalodisca vitripennis]
MRRLRLPPTRITSETSTSIDCVCTNFIDPDITATVIQSGLSDHTAQTCKLGCNTDKNLTQTLIQQLSRKNLDTLKSLLSIKNWDAVYHAVDTETAFTTFQEVLQITLDISCPQRTTKKKNKSRPRNYYDKETSDLKSSYLNALKNMKLQEVYKTKLQW